jgi:hypothetical protein
MIEGDIEYSLLNIDYSRPGLVVSIRSEVVQVGSILDRGNVKVCLDHAKPHPLQLSSRLTNI